MIVDCTGIELLPGNNGEDCPGNGMHKDKNGQPIACCCDECDYLLCCLPEYKDISCLTCTDHQCPRSGSENFPFK